MNFIINKLQENIIIKLNLFTDTDSLVYEIETNDVYKAFMRIKICLILVIIHKTHNVFTLSIKRLLAK